MARCFAVHAGVALHPLWEFDLNDPDIVDPKPPMLYHYTDAAGLTGFVKSGSQLLATHHEFVNDSEEIRFGRDIALEVLQSLNLADEVEAMAVAKTDEFLTDSSFIACLSESQHVLPQWRLYANETAGYCLGFKDPRSRLYTSNENDHLAYTLCKCMYGAPQLRERLEQRFQRKIDRLEEVVDDDKNKVLAEHLAQVACRYAQLAKHEHFQFESEWRFIVSESNPSIEYRLTKHGLTPYLLTDMLQLEEVWIGPGIGPSPDKARAAVTEFLTKHNLTASVHHWKTSYRR